MATHNDLEDLLKTVKKPAFWDNSHLKDKFWHKWYGPISHVEFFDMQNVLNLSPTGVKITGVRLYDKGKNVNVELFLKAGTNPNKTKSLNDEEDQYGEAYQIQQRIFWNRRMLPTPEVVLADMHGEIPLIVCRYGKNSSHGLDLLALKDVISEISTVLGSDFYDDNVRKQWQTGFKKAVDTKDRILESMLKTDNEFHVLGSYWAREENLKVREYDNFSDYYLDDKITFYTNTFFEWDKKTTGLSFDKIQELDLVASKYVLQNSDVDLNSVSNLAFEDLSDDFDSCDFKTLIKLVRNNVAKKKVDDILEDLKITFGFMNDDTLIGYSTGDGFAHNYQFFYYEDEHILDVTVPPLDLIFSSMHDVYSRSLKNSSNNGIVKSATFDPESTVFEHLFINYAKKLVSYDYITGIIDEDSQRSPESTISRVNSFFNFALGDLLEKYSDFMTSRRKELERNYGEDSDEFKCVDMKYVLEDSLVNEVIVEQRELRRDEFYIFGLCEIINTIGRRVNHQLNNPVDYLRTTTSSVHYHPFDENEVGYGVRKNARMIQFPDVPGVPGALKLDVYKVDNALSSLFEMKDHIKQVYDASTPENSRTINQLIEVIDTLESVYDG